jgi:hypothetical protein
VAFLALVDDYVVTIFRRREVPLAAASAPPAAAKPFLRVIA